MGGGEQFKGSRQEKIRTRKKIYARTIELID